jgi:acetyl-CoA acetyltransferase
MSFGEQYLRQTLQFPRVKRRQSTRVVHYQIQHQGLELGNAFGFHGPITVISNACASGANAIGHAFEMVRGGHAGKVLTGGYDALCRLTFAGSFPWMWPDRMTGNQRLRTLSPCMSGWMFWSTTRECTTTRFWRR